MDKSYVESWGNGQGPPLSSLQVTENLKYTQQQQSSAVQENGHSAGWLRASRAQRTVSYRCMPVCLHLLRHCDLHSQSGLRDLALAVSQTSLRLRMPQYTVGSWQKECLSCHWIHSTHWHIHMLSYTETYAHRHAESSVCVYLCRCVWVESRGWCLISSSVTLWTWCAPVG